MASDTVAPSSYSSSTSIDSVLSFLELAIVRQRKCSPEAVHKEGFCLIGVKGGISLANSSFFSGFNPPFGQSLDLPLQV
ncbi:hypothetical protein ZIOFF_036595 [Zingiber officinale]|uniref:Uncharacterized protein n=1 Tax=Zingiber officinale TaxID=94328 RepID=A0A8J5L2H1_ZINOF|nr:hypothetical protein ZIOFF_036595 [Zingiber officinale]